MRYTALYFFLALALLALVGCGNNTADAPAPTPEEEQAKTAAHAAYYFSCRQEGYNFLERLAEPRLNPAQKAVAEYLNHNLIEDGARNIVAVWAEAIGNQPHDLSPSAWETELVLFRDLWEAINVARLADEAGVVAEAKQTNEFCAKAMVAADVYLTLRDGDLPAEEEIVPEPQINITESLPLAADAPEWVAAEAQQVIRNYGSGYGLSGLFGWGSCTFPGQVGDCLWVAWSNTDGLRQVQVNQPLPEEIVLRFQAQGRADLYTETRDGDVVVNRHDACRHDVNDDGETYLAIYNECSLPEWTDTRCNQEGCNRQAVLDELVRWFNSSGIGLQLKRKQYVY